MIPTHRSFASIIRDVCPDWATYRVNLCADDLVELFDDGKVFISVRQCYEEWLRRIGGKQNLDSYSDSLAARSKS